MPNRSTLWRCAFVFGMLWSSLGTVTVEGLVTVPSGAFRSSSEPGRTIRVTGFGNQYDSAYEVDPRSQKDVRPVR